MEFVERMALPCPQCRRLTMHTVTKDKLHCLLCNQERARNGKPVPKEVIPISAAPRS